MNQKVDSLANVAEVDHSLVSQKIDLPLEMILDSSFYKSLVKASWLGWNKLMQATNLVL